jgi:hypothetical protein
LATTSNYYSDDWNWYNWFPAENKNNILEKWFWIYMGYSWSQKKYVAYIRYDDHERIITRDNTNHFIPYNLYLDFPRDRYYSAYKGLVKDVFVDAGPGAFRTNNFEALHKTPLNLGNLADADVTYEQPALYEMEVPLDDL